MGLSMAFSWLSFTPAAAEVIPVDAVIFGKTYGEWGGEWWNWALYEPFATNPIADETGEDGHLNQAGPVWFLAGTWGGTAVREVIIPEGKTLFFPLVNSVMAVPDDAATEAEVRALAKASIDPASLLYATVDGAQLLGLFSLRAESPPGGYVQHVPPGSVLTEWGYPPGDRYPAVADGYWVALEPLPLGDHEIYFTAAVGNPKAPDLELEVTYTLHVIPEPSTLVLLIVGAVGLIGCAWCRRRR
jgi:hypothetical protein